MRDPETSAKPEAVRRIVVLRPNHRIGNTLLLTPLMQELEARFPAAQVDLVSAGGVAQVVFARYPRVSARHAFPGKSYRHPGTVLRVLLQLRSQRYDLAIDPTVRSRAGRFLLRFVRARRRLGFRWNDAGQDRTLTDAVDPSLAPAHHADIPVYLLRAAGLASADYRESIVQRSMDLRLSDVERGEGAADLENVLGGAAAGASHTVGLFAHATGAKCLPIEWWRELVEKLQQRAPAIRLVEFTPEDARSRLEGLVSSTYTPQIRRLGAKLAATSVMVVADGGVMHLADASGAVTFALFLTTSPAQYGPRRPGSESLNATDLPASRVAELICQRLQPGAGPRFS